MISFSVANAKLESLYNVTELQTWLTHKRKVYSFDLLSGWSCPFARDCMAKVQEVDGKKKLVDGPHTQFRCFSASQEATFPSAYNKRKANFDGLRNLSQDEMVKAISQALPKNAGIVRVHVAGDFFSRDYMRAWMMVAQSNPSILFYAYTKSLGYWVELGNVPANFVLTASRGGRQDDLIAKHNLREAVVVYSEQQASEANLEIDHTDEHAAIPSQRNKSFALLIHGVQPKGSQAAEAIKTLKKTGIRFAYNRKEKTA